MYLVIATTTINNIKIVLTKGSKMNFKVTDNNDLLIAKLLASIL